jgi:membrane-bound serine protease (ClpP class)
VGIGVTIGLLTAFVLAKVLQAQRRPPSTGMEALVGATAEVRTTLDPVGSVFLNGERWRAVSEDGSEIPTGAVVEVVAVRGFELRVRSREGPEAG